MKAYLYLLAVFLLCSTVSAEFVIFTDKDNYNLGDRIAVSYSVSPNKSLSGLTDISLSCPDFELKFYTSPTSADAGRSLSVSVPSLPVDSRMLGSCSVLGRFLSFNNSISLAGSTEVFSITEAIGLSASAPSKLKPASKLPFTISLDRSFSSPASVSFSFLGQNYAFPVVDGLFNYTLSLPAKMKSGHHEIKFEAGDSYGNRGYAVISYEVEPVPSEINLVLEENTFLPGSLLVAKAHLLDQASEDMKEIIFVEMTDGTGRTLFNEQGMAPATLATSIGRNLAPGVYTISAYHGNIYASSAIIVKPLKNISVSFDSRYLNLTNTGNIDYLDDFLVSLNGSQHFFVLSDRIKLAPGDSKAIDLFNEVPEDDYEVSFPSAPEVAEFSAHLIDERSMLRKTGNLIGIVGIRADKNFMPIVSLALLLAAAFFFVKRPFTQIKKKHV